MNVFKSMLLASETNINLFCIFAICILVCTAQTLAQESTIDDVTAATEETSDASTSEFQDTSEMTDNETITSDHQPTTSTFEDFVSVSDEITSQSAETTISGDNTTPGDIAGEECEKNPCENGATCRMNMTHPLEFSCECLLGFVGWRCQTRDFCGLPSDSCGSATCVYTEDMTLRYCQCFGDSLWVDESRSCREPEAPCFPNPCLNKGTCSPQPNGEFNCTCIEHYIGRRCEVQDLCGKDSKGNICGRGKCINDRLGNKKYCHCLPSYYYNSEERVCKKLESPCEVDPCHGQSCEVTSNGTQFQCNCDSLHTGSQCEILMKCPMNETEPYCNEGSCQLSNDNTTMLCNCEEGFALDLTTSDCRKKMAPCFPNPCANGGTCEAEGTNYTCSCEKGFVGDLCTTRDRCVLDGGGEFCNGGKCFTDPEQNIFSCSCGENEYFDFNQRMCLPSDLCSLRECGEYMECKNNKCQCASDFVMDSKTQKCQPNFCKTRGCPVESMECTENPEKPEHFYCNCPNGMAFDGKSCTPASCSFPTLNNCQQKCDDITDGFKCGCYDDYVLKDNTTCANITDNSCINMTCNIGECSRHSEGDVCLCPPGYVLQNNGQCIDSCTLGSLPSGLCPNDLCDLNGKTVFRCRCTGKYTYAADNVRCTMRPMCSAGNEGFSKCSAKQAECIEDWKSDDGFYCQCRQGYSETPDGTCRRICDIEENQIKCSKLRAVCGTDENYGFICKCPPLMTADRNGTCNKLAYSFLVTFPVDSNIYRHGIPDNWLRSSRAVPQLSIDDHAVEADVSKSMKRLFSGFQTASILKCKDEGSYSLCKVEIQLSHLGGGEYFNRLLMASSFVHDPFVSNDTWLLPPSLVLRAEAIRAMVSYKVTDACDDDVKQRLCNPDTICESFEQGYTCKCRPGYRVWKRYYPTNDINTYAEICEDIDECNEDDPCPSTTDCVNTAGSYRCECLPGYREDTESTTMECIEICNPNPCVHGECKETSKHAFECRCEAGFAGSLCNYEDKNYKRAKKDAIIVGVVLGGILLITIILSLVYVFNLRKKYSEEPNQILYSTEMTERRPVNLSAANPIFERE